MFALLLVAVYFPGFAAEPSLLQPLWLTRLDRSSSSSSTSIDRQLQSSDVHFQSHLRSCLEAWSTMTLDVWVFPSFHCQTPPNKSFIFHLHPYLVPHFRKICASPLKCSHTEEMQMEKLWWCCFIAFLFPVSNRFKRIIKHWISIVWSSWWSGLSELVWILSHINFHTSL